MVITIDMNVCYLKRASLNLFIESFIVNNFFPLIRMACERKDTL